MGRKIRLGEGQPDCGLDVKAGLALHPRPRRALQRASQPGLSQHRLHSLHSRRQAGRRSTRRTLARIRQNGVRPSYHRALANCECIEGRESRRINAASAAAPWKSGPLGQRLALRRNAGVSPIVPRYPAWQKALEIPPQSRAGSATGKNNSCSRCTDSSTFDSSTRNEIVRSDALWQTTRTSIFDTAANARLATSGCRRIFSPTRQTSALWFSHRTLAVPCKAPAIVGRGALEPTSSDIWLSDHAITSTAHEC